MHLHTHVHVFSWSKSYADLTEADFGHYVTVQLVTSDFIKMPFVQNFINLKFEVWTFTKFSKFRVFNEQPVRNWSGHLLAMVELDQSVTLQSNRTLWKFYGLEKDRDWKLTWNLKFSRSWSWVSGIFFQRICFQYFKH